MCTEQVLVCRVAETNQLGMQSRSSTVALVTFSGIEYHRAPVIYFGGVGR